MSAKGCAVLFSIGHSNHALDAFVGLLRQHNVDVVVDVRSSPYSKFNPQFNRDSLADALRTASVRYAFFGKELGARVDDASCYVDGKVQYGRLAARQEFRDAIARLVSGAADHRLALMCAEKEPLDCHRTILVSQALAEAGHVVNHIHADGRLESHREALGRLVEMTGVAQGDFFSGGDDVLRLALAEQEARIAYRKKDEAVG